MGYKINSTWTKLRERDIEKLNKIIDDEYCNELEIGRKLNLMDKLTKAFDKELATIDFDIITNYMEMNNWTWAMYKNGKSFYKVPSKEYIIDSLRNETLKHALFNIIELKKKEYYVESGGLVFNMGINDDESSIWCRIYFDIAH